MANARFTPSGTPVGPAKESAGCCDKRNCPNVPKGEPCVRSRVFASGTKAFANYTAGSTCMMWGNGVNVSTAGKAKIDGCAQASDWSF